MDNRWVGTAPSPASKQIFWCLSPVFPLASWIFTDSWNSRYMKIPWRIHGAGIYANIKAVYWWDPCYHIYHTWILWEYMYNIFPFIHTHCKRMSFFQTAKRSSRFFWAVRPYGMVPHWNHHIRAIPVATLLKPNIMCIYIYYTYYCIILYYGWGNAGSIWHTAVTGVFHMVVTTTKNDAWIPHPRPCSHSKLLVVPPNIWHGKITIFNGKITILNGKIHYFDWAIFNSKLLNYQRVTIVSGYMPTSLDCIWMTDGE